mgnify:CR=1 FL=1|tara:strand:- start:23083 stop:24375 length:1293 start_codon:yes stop_codon:yes gene_type:complete
MKILLIKPKWYVKGGPYRYTETIRFPPVNLGVIAALSKGHFVKLIDEDEEEIIYSKNWDLVGITVVTFTFQAAFKIADRFKKLGVKVVLGGVHATLKPQDCLKHADAVVVGEAENVWSKLLRDLEKNKLKKIYKSKELVNMDDVPMPDNSLYPYKYTFGAIQTSRGCTNTCKFCYLRSMPWKKFRHMSVNRAIKEMKRVKQKYLIFSDDNMFLDREYCLELFKAMRPLKKLWWSQAPVNIGLDEELLQAMKKSGCYCVAIGFQTVNQDSADWVKIRQNKVIQYKKIVSNLHKYKIMVQSYFMLGFDYDKKDVFKKTTQMIKDIDLDDAYLYIVTPYPGTELYNKYEKEERIITKDLKKYGWYNATFKPKHMTPKELEQGIKDAYKEINLHFIKQLPRKTLFWWKLSLKHPYLAKVIMKGQLRKVDVTKLP